jgi:hypothetical protein
MIYSQEEKELLLLQCNDAWLFNNIFTSGINRQGLVIWLHHAPDPIVIVVGAGYLPLASGLIHILSKQGLLVKCILF